jgi:nicotinamidase-related amidase/alkylated DNA repair dioxygenase AlkB
MLSLLELVTQNQPHFQTHQALLVLGLQNDFILPDGKLPVNTRNGFLDRIHALIPTFRKQSSNVIWTKTLYETDRLASDPTTGEGDAVVVGGLVDGVESSTDEDDDLPKDLIRPTQPRSSTSKHRLRALNLLKRVSARKTTSASPREELQAVVEEDEELFLRQSSKNGPACLPGTSGAEFADTVKSKIEPSDTVVQTTNYSAFQGTSLLLILRARLVTEVYICGCITNVNVLATVIDAARHGIRINVVGDCLGFRRQSRHKIALKRMIEFFDANIVTSQDVIDRNMPGGALPITPQKDSQDEQQLQDMVKNLRVSEPRPTDQPNATHVPRGQTPTKTVDDSKDELERTSFVNGWTRKPSDTTSLAESRATSDTKLSDEQFTERLIQGAKVMKPDRQPEKQNLVKSKIRMRPRTSKDKEKDKDKGKDKDKDKDKDKKPEERKSKADSSKTGGKGDMNSGASLLPPAEREPDRSAKTPKAAMPADKTRPTVIAKAESSDKLRHSPSRSDRSLKPSASQPALSSACPDKDITSRVRVALTRAPKTDSNEELPTQPQASSTKSTAPVARSTTPSEKTIPKVTKLQSLATFPILGPNDRIAEGDSRIIYDFFPPELYHPSDRSKPLQELVFTQVYNEVRWQKMHYQEGEVPRLVCAQGDFSADGSMPIYRHPADQTLPLLHFSPKVQLIRKQAEKLVGHPLNHVLIQLYRSGTDYISEHSDKSLDIARGSSIVNVSLGAQRTMRLRTKKSDKADDSQRETQRIAMPHNSMFVLGLESNSKWLHGIMADKRIASERSNAENAYEGMRISLTFRHIATYLDAKCRTIWGQGATTKDQRDAADVINDDEEENERLVRAFSRENHALDFDWNHWYGDGFDVLHFKGSPKDLPILFASNNQVDNDIVKIYLAERNIEYSFIEAPKIETACEVDRQVAFRDTDINRTEVAMPVLVIGYLERFYTLDNDERSRPCMVNSYDILIMVAGLLKHWHNRNVSTYPHSFVDSLELLEERYAFTPGQFISGRRFAHSDCVAWVALDELIRNWDGWSEEGFPNLTGYYRMIWKKKKSVQTFRPELCDIPKSKPTKGKERAEE